MKFLGQNLIELFDSFTPTSSTTTANSYDKDLTTSAVSIGSDDATPEVFTIIWAAAQTFDRLCFRGINWKDYEVKYWDGAAYQSFVSDAVKETANASTTKFYEFTSVSTLRIQITINKTITADAEKSVAEILAYLETLDLSEDWLPKEKPSLPYKQHLHELVGGGAYQVTESTIEKYRNKLTWNRSNPLLTTYVTTLKTIKDTLEPFWFIPFDDEPENQYNVIWANDYNFQKIGAWSAGLRCYAGSLEMRET